MDNYRGVPLNYNKHNWGTANIISDVEECNRILKIGFDSGTLELTTNGHLKKTAFMGYGAVWLSKHKSSLEFLVYKQKKLYRFVFRPALETDVEFTGIDALRILKQECGSILKPYAVRSNADVAAIKATIPKLMIYLTGYGKGLLNVAIKNVVHLDINSAFPAGVVANHPEFKEFFEHHYERRKEDKIHKAVMNYSIGACQSLKIRGNRYPQLAKSAIEWTNAQLRMLTKRLEQQGHKVLGYNTDGIFYERASQKPLYTDENEGTALGQWKTDAVFDVIRFKSAGSYEYIKDGKYYAVVRGSTRLDRIKPRTEWEWGDIYQATEIVLVLNNNQIKEVEVEDGET